MVFKRFTTIADIPGGNLRVNRIHCMSSPVADVGVSRRPSLFVKLLVGILASVALFAVYNTLSADEVASAFS